MTQLALLSEKEQHDFEYPPRLPLEVKRICFAITSEVKAKVNALRTASNKVGFLLQYGYFKACKRFFMVDRFPPEDIEYAAKLIGVSLHEVDLNRYRKKTPIYHQAII